MRNSTLDSNLGRQKTQVTKSSQLQVIYGRHSVTCNLSLLDPQVRFCSHKVLRCLQVVTRTTLFDINAFHPDRTSRLYRVVFTKLFLFLFDSCLKNIVWYSMQLMRRKSTFTRNCTIVEGEAVHSFQSHAASKYFFLSLHISINHE
jgi:hypothetical protein